jgi:type VI secretion system secreted protein Hcp
MAMPSHLTLEGEKQGKIEGSCEMVGQDGTILVYGVHHKVKLPHRPTDGLPTGKRSHYPLSILKEYDASSPKLYQALCTGEHMKDVTIKWYRITKQGTEEHYFTTKLEDAIITNVTSFMPITLVAANEPFRHMEDVSFSYKNIRWAWEPHGIEAEDSHVTMDHKDIFEASLIGDSYKWIKWLWHAKELTELAKQITDAKNKSYDAMSKGKNDEAIIYDELARNLEKIYLQRLRELGLSAPNNVIKPSTTLIK